MKKNFFYFFILIIVFYFSSTLLQFTLTSIVNLNDKYYDLKYSFAKGKTISKNTILKVNPSFIYNEKKKEIVYFDTKGNITFKIKSNLKIIKIFHFYFVPYNFYLVGVKIKNKIYFINVFANFLNYIKIFFAELPLILFFLYLALNKVSKIEEEQEKVNLINEELYLNNKITMSLIEQFHHKFNTPFEFLERLKEKEKISQKDIISLYLMFKEIKELVERMEEMDTLIKRIDFSFFDIIEKGFKLSFMKDLMYSVNFEIDEELKKYKPLKEKDKELILILFYKIAIEFMKNNILEVKIKLDKFSKNTLFIIAFNFNVSEIDTSLILISKAINAKFKIKNNNLILEIPGKKID